MARHTFSKAWEHDKRQTEEAGGRAQAFKESLSTGSTEAESCLGGSESELAYSTGGGAQSYLRQYTSFKQFSDFFHVLLWNPRESVLGRICWWGGTGLGSHSEGQH